jgi:hypothetical protein
MTEFNDESPDPVQPVDLFGSVESPPEKPAPRARKPKPQPEQAAPVELPIPGESPDPFDPARHSLGADYTDGFGAVRQRRVVVVRRPSRQEWFRVHPGAEYRMDCTLYKPDAATGGESDEVYLVLPEMRGLVGDAAHPARIHLAVNRQGDAFLWNLRLPDPDGTAMKWHTTALAIAGDAMERWVQMRSNRRGGYYDVFFLGEKVEVSDPTWPTETFRELLRLAFADRVIDSQNHVIIRQLQGLI